LYDKAITDCSKVLATNPRAGQIYDARGSAFFAKGIPEKAIADWSAAIACNNKDSFALAMRGTIYQKQKKYDLALADLNRVITLIPDSATKSKYYRERLELYKLLGEKNEDLIASDYERIGALEAKNADVRYRFAVIAWRKQPDLATKDLTEAIAIEPANGKYYALRGRIEAETSHNDEAIKDSTKAIEIDPNNIESYRARAQAYLANYKFTEALADSDKAISIDAKLPEPYYFKAGSLEGLRQSKSAVEAYSQFVTLKSTESNRSNEDDRRLEQAKRKVELLKANLSESEKAALNTPATTAPTTAAPSTTAPTK
jgi:tetratricopeptide (TPR) repeat protein